MIIYKTTNLLNGKIYIGQDAYNKKSYYGSGNLIKRAIAKYSKENFQKDILCTCDSKDEMNEKEIFFIKYFRELGYELYNVANGGEGQLNPSIQTRKKLSKGMKGKKAWNRGLTKETDERVKKYSENLKGTHKFYGKDNSNYGKRYTFSKEINLKKGRKGILNPFYGKGYLHLGKNNPCARKYIFHSPCGIKHIIIGNILNFCKNQNLKYWKMRENLNKNIHFYNGWNIYQEVGSGGGE